MSRRVGVIGVCDSGGLTASLRVLLPKDTVHPLSGLRGSEDEKRAWLASARESFDVILVNNIHNLPEVFALESQNLRIIKYPHINFHAFHPDLTYVFRLTDGNRNLIEPSYNSCICIWAFINGLPAEKTVRLFNHDVFSALGYFDEWGPSVTNLSEKFTEFGLDFRRFLLKVKRAGSFMLSSNHPKIVAITALAKCIAINKLGEAPSLWDAPEYVSDGLASQDWPVYPEIGEFYGIKSDYAWNFDRKIMGLSEYVHSVYRHYSEKGLKLGEVYFGRDRPTIDAVLSAHLGG